MTDGGARPAFYALAPGGWRDYVSLLHPPYTAWHLAYVGIGAALAPVLSWERLGWTAAAFALAMGVGAHALDELNGRPLATAVPDRTLVALAALSVAAATAIGVAAALAWTAWLVPAVAAGAFVVVAYNLELWAGRFHGDVWFALAWGAFPVVVAYLAQAETLRAEALLAAAAAALLSLAQRRLSTEVRFLRRKAIAVHGAVELRDGQTVELDRERLVAPTETALRLLAAAVVTLAAALLVTRV